MSAAFAQSSASYGSVKRLLVGELDRLKQQPVSKTSPEQPDSERLFFLQSVSAHMGENEALINTLVVLVNNMTQQGKMSFEDGQEIYGGMAEWQKQMEQRLREYLEIPASQMSHVVNYFKSKVKDIATLFQENPKNAAAGVGAAMGALLLHKYVTGICVSSKLLASLGLTCGCQTVGWVAAAGVGGLLGCFAVGLAACLYKLYTWWFPTEKPQVAPSVATFHEQVQERLNALKQSAGEDMDTEVLKRLVLSVRVVWDREADICPVCLEIPLEPVLFAGCSRHYHCHKCIQDCLASGRRVCTLCGQ